jgi:hypothetical protein
MTFNLYYDVIPGQINGITAAQATYTLRKVTLILFPTSVAKNIPSQK